MFCRCIVLSDDDYLQRMKEDEGQEYISGDMLRLHLTKREWDQFYRQWRRWMHAQFPVLSERRQSVGGSPSGAIRSVGDRPLEAVRRRQSVGGSPSKSYVHPCERSRSGALRVQYMLLVLPTVHDARHFVLHSGVSPFQSDTTTTVPVVTVCHTVQHPRPAFSVFSSYITETIIPVCFIDASFRLDGRSRRR